jgi:hypothetical protein
MIDIGYVFYHNLNQFRLPVRFKNASIPSNPVTAIQS